MTQRGAPSPALCAHSNAVSSPVEIAPLRPGIRSHIRIAPTTGGRRVARTPIWLDVDPRPLDWNGPVGRLFTRFPDAGLDRPIIDHFEHAARLHRDRIAVRDAQSALTHGELWDGLSGLA